MTGSIKSRTTFEQRQLTREPHAFTLVVVRARLCIHVASKGEDGGEEGVSDCQQGLEFFFSGDGAESSGVGLTTSQ